MTDPALATIEQQKETAYQRTLHHPVCENSGFAFEHCECPTCERRQELRAELRKTRAAIRTVMESADCGEGMRAEWIRDHLLDERRYRRELAELEG